METSVLELDLIDKLSLAIGLSRDLILACIAIGGYIGGFIAIYTVTENRLLAFIFSFSTVSAGVTFGLFPLYYLAITIIITIALSRITFNFHILKTAYLFVMKPWIIQE